MKRFLGILSLTIAIISCDNSSSGNSANDTANQDDRSTAPTQPISPSGTDSTGLGASGVEIDTTGSKKSGSQADTTKK